MDVTELRLKKRELRNRLAKLIFEEIEQFKHETGISVNGLTASFQNATDFTDEFPQYVLAGVDVDLATDL